MKKDKLVSVDWEDICGYSAWKTEEQAKECGGLFVNTVGRMFSKDKKYLKVYQGISECDQLLDLCVIPIGNIIKITKIKEKKGR